MNRRKREWAGRAGALVLLLAPFGLAVLVAPQASCSKGPQVATKFHCPMHPTYVSDQPGDCPICGMRLVPFDPGKGGDALPATSPGAPGTARSPAPAAASPAAPAAPATGPASPANTAPHPPATTLWTCPMDPDVIQDHPGKCPKCGMDLEPMPAPPVPGTVPGLSTVLTTEEGRRLSGVQTVEARRERIERTIRAVGTVVADETRVRHVHTKIAGWVDKLYVDYTGQAVRKGMPILTLYSRELMASQEEYLQALQAAKQFQGSSLPEVRKGGDDLVRAARQRLELFDVPEGFIVQLERTGKPQHGVPLLAPASGIVTAKETFEGHQVEPGMDLFTITDLSHVWIEADLHENEAGLVHVGNPAVLTLTSDPTARLEGRVAYVYPYLDPRTRTLKVRFDFANADGALKPAMYADVRMTLQAAEGVVVPDAAVMDTGLRQVVFVAGADGAFQPRAVTIGLRTEGRAQVLAGLAAGERVAVAANFLLDSESRLRSALETPR